MKRCLAATPGAIVLADNSATKQLMHALGCVLSNNDAQNILASVPSDIFFLFLRLNELFMLSRNCPPVLKDVVFLLLCCSFGLDLSIRWLQSLLFSFLESFLVSQPIMVSSS